MFRRLLPWVLGGAVSATIGGAVVLRWDPGMEKYEQYYVNDARPLRDGMVKVTFLGTSTLVLEDGKTTVLVDGFITRPSMFRVATSRLRTNRTLVDSALNRVTRETIDAVFTVHSHYDHALDAAYIARSRRAQLYGSASTRMVGLGDSVRAESITVFVPGVVNPVGEFRVTALRSRHSPQVRLVRFLGEITDTLEQLARVWEYKEGGSFDMLIEHRNNAILIKASPALDRTPRVGLRADVVFLGIGTLGRQDREFQNAYYQQSVRGVGATRVIPIHWDNFFAPLSDQLPPAGRLMDNSRAAFDFIIARTQQDSIRFQILQGYGSVILFAPEMPGAITSRAPPVHEPALAGGRRTVGR